MVKLWKYFKRLNCSSCNTCCCCAYDTLKDDQSQVVKLPNGDSITIQGYERSCLKTFMTVFVSLITLFIGPFIASHRPGGLTPWFYRRSALSRATKVLLPPHSLVKIQQDDDGRRWFVWRHNRFTWCSQSGKFKRVRFVDEIGLRFSDMHGLGSGLDASNHRLRKENYGINKTDIAYPASNLIVLYFSALVKPSRLFHIVAVAIWIIQKYYVYAGFIGFVALIELGSSIYLKYQHQRRLHLMSLCTCEVTVLSPGHEKHIIMSDDLVPGCVIELPRSQKKMMMPCDAVILSGSCVARESSAAKPKPKYQLPKSRTQVYNPKTHGQHTLLRGSSIALNTDKLIALVIRTGWSTEIGTNLAVKLENHDSSRRSTFDRHCDHLFLCLGLVGLCAASYGIYVRHSSFDVLYLIPEGMSFIIVCLPPLFFPALFFTSLYSFFRLYNSGFRFNCFDEPSSLLNHAGATDTVCVLENVIMENADVSLFKVLSARYDAWSRDPQLTLCMAACVNQHSSDDLAMFNNSTWRVVAQDIGHSVQSIINEHEIYRVTNIYVEETNPSLPLVLVRADPVDSVNAASWYFLRGSYLNVIEFAEEFSFSMKENQLQLVAFAGRQLTEVEKSSTLDPDLSLLSRKFQLLGVASIGYKMSKETCSAISELRSANIGTVLISHREPEEVVHLARSAGIILTKEPVAKIEIPSMEAMHPPSLSVIDLPETNQQAEVENGEHCVKRHAHVVLTGEMLDALLQSFPEMVDEIVGRVTVFAAANSLQTNRFLEKLHGLNRNILVCKNGEDHYWPTVPVTCLTLTKEDERQSLHRDLCSDRSIGSVRELLGQSRASLVKCLGMCKLMVCYAGARLTFNLLLYDNPSPAIQTLYVDLALVMAPVMWFGCTRASNEPLSKKTPSKSIVRPKEIVSVFVQLALVVASQFCALIMAQHQPWFERTLLRTNWTGDSVVSDENYAVYSLSLFQYLNLFLLFSSGPPHLRRIWTNLGLTFYLIMMSIFCLVMVLEPPEQLKLFMGLKIPPVFDFRLAILSLAVIYVFTSLGFQCLIDYCSIPACSTCRSSSVDQATPLVNVNVVYRPYTLNTHSHDFPQPIILNLPIF